MRIIFFGTSGFAAQILKYLIDHSFNIVAIVTRPDRPKGRNLQQAFSQVKEAALEKIPSIPLLQPEKASTPENFEILKNFNADVFLVVAYGEIIKKNLLDLPRLGCFNIHASLLPKYRGAAPIQRCLMDGEEKTGINIIEMTPQMDAGDVVASAEMPIPEDMNFGELERRLCALACDLTVKFLKQLASGTITKAPQDVAQVTFAAKLQPQDEIIDWNRSAQDLHNQIRALSPAPGAWCAIQIGSDRKRLKIKRATIVKNFAPAEPGTILSKEKNALVIACKEGALQLLQVQLEGKKEMPIGDFLRGYSQLSIKFFK